MCGKYFSAHKQAQPLSQIDQTKCYLPWVSTFSPPPTST
eukprot:UN04500